MYSSSLPVVLVATSLFYYQNTVPGTWYGTRVNFRLVLATAPYYY